MLNITELSSLFHGAYSLERDSEGYIIPVRSSEEQTAYAASLREDFGEKLHYATSVTIELETDAKRISFDYEYKNVRNLRGGIDAWVNGRLSKIFYADETKVGCVELLLPEGNKSVVFYLPCEKQTCIKKFRVEGSWCPVPPRRSRLLVIGDSITAGVGSEITSLAYINIFNREYRYEMLNQSVGGFAYNEGFLMPLEGFYPDKIIISMGTNQHKASDREERFDNFYKRLSELYPSVPVLVITPIIRLDAGGDPEALRETGDMLRKTCSSYENITVIDGLDILPPESCFFADGLHPNALGAALYGETVARIVSELGF